MRAKSRKKIVSTHILSKNFPNDFIRFVNFSIRPTKSTPKWPDKQFCILCVFQNAKKVKFVTGNLFMFSLLVSASSGHHSSKQMYF